jgi:hypothetical protein
MRKLVVVVAALTVAQAALADPADATWQLAAGQSFFNPRGMVHTLIGAPNSQAIVLSTWIADRGKPLLEPVDQ